MTKKQKIALLRIALRWLIIAVLTVLIICLYNSIHNLKTQNKAISERVTAIETEMAKPNPTEPEQTEPEGPTFITLGEFKITGYVATCEHCCGKTDGITASMKKAKVGRTVAMNRADMEYFDLSYGDEIIIEGLGTYIVEDTGCGRNVIDVACSSHEDCYKITGYYDVLRKE